MSIFAQTRMAILLVAVALVASSCSLLGTEEAAPPEPLKGWSNTVPPAAGSADGGSADSNPPDAISLVDEEPSGALEAWQPDQPRRTNEGIEVVARLTEFDFNGGDGPELATEITAKNGNAGVYLPGELVADTEFIDILGWGMSGSTFVALAEVGPTVAEVRLSSTKGGVDRVAPGDNRTAVVAVRADDLAQVTMKAFTANGQLVGTCANDDLFFNCKPNYAIDQSEIEPVSTESQVADQPRLTTEGIEVGVELVEFDFYDNGVIEPGANLTGKNIDGIDVGSSWPYEIEETADILTILGWTKTGDTFLMLAKADPTVAEVRLASPLGGLDRIGPGENGLAALAVLIDEFGDATMEAVDADGTPLSICKYAEDKHQFVCSR